MISSAIMLALAALGAANQAAAQDDNILNQLETPRLVQGAQRVEFGVEGDTSAFKFSFADPVLLPVVCALHGAAAKSCRHEIAHTTRYVTRSLLHCFQTTAMQYSFMYDDVVGRVQLDRLAVAL